ncbi:MAG TPA: cyclase family protein [Anaerolineae bacterium]|nr:cyclase family protein [Anaerolineae bacterium]
MTEVLDLTRCLDGNLPIYAEGDYSDPPLQVEPWCTITVQGFRVSRLCMGTQTGTHIDAPAHFLDGGATLESLPARALVGRYLWLDLDVATLPDVGELAAAYAGETMLFLASRGSEVAQPLFEALLELPCPVWIIADSVRVTGREALYFHRALSKAGRFLIEDLDTTTSVQVRPGGEIVALPLRLKGVSGSPCRVLVRQDEASSH